MRACIVSNHSDAPRHDVVPFSDRLKSKVFDEKKGGGKLRPSECYRLELE